MLNRLALANFKAWQKADLAFGKVTGFFGANSAGKSSLLQFLLLLKQTKNATDRGLVLDFGGQTDLFEGPRDYANLGTFADVVHRHDDARTIRWQLDWTLPRKLRIDDPAGSEAEALFQGDGLGLKCAVALEGQHLRTRELAYLFDDAAFSVRPGAALGDGFQLAAKGTKFQFKRQPGRPRPLPPPVKTHLFPSQAKSDYQNSDFLGDFELAYEQMMDAIYYLGPLRVYPRRQYHWSGASPQDVGPSGERTMDAVLAATRDQEVRRLRPQAPGVRKIAFQKIIAHWLKQLGLIHTFSLEEMAAGTNLYRAMVKTSPSSTPTALTDVGFGVSQVLPTLVLLYYVPEGATVLMEQPEIHLHPAVQAGLADVMLNVAAARNVQIIVESHSEHLLRRLQRRVAEESASAEDVKLYFVSSRRGQAHAADLSLNEWGEIENWPQNFFGDEVGEIGAIAEASLRRKMAQAAK